MAEIKSIEINNNDRLVSLNISEDEQKLLKQSTTDLLLLPVGQNAMVKHLTTGKLGNSNRIMLPKKMIKAENINELDKRVPAQIFGVNGDIFLLIKLKKSGIGIPKFEDDGNDND